jgi:hypothetical protein
VIEQKGRPPNSFGIRHGTVPLTPTIATHCHRILQGYFPGQFRGGVVSGHIPRPIGSIALVATLLVSGVGIGVPTNMARAERCLSAPNSLAPQGSHWYYQLDWATQRKCWYLRALGPPAQQAAAPATLAGVAPVHSMPAQSEPLPAAVGAPMASPGHTTPPSPHVKILAVKPKPAEVITATTDKLAQRSAQEGNTAPSLIEAPAPQLSTSPQPNAQAAGPAPAAPVAWPDAPPGVASVKALEPIAVPTGVDSVSGDAEWIDRSGEPTKHAGMPIIIFPILALGLAAVGILSRAVMKTVAARRAESQRIDDQDQHLSIDQRREFHSLISAVSDSGLFRAEGGDYQIAHQISKRRDKLAQLRQVLDRLLQHEPREERDLAMTGAG